MLCYIQVHHFHAKSSLCGFEAAIVGSVPLGGGVSSSASVEVMMMMVMMVMMMMMMVMMMMMMTMMVTMKLMKIIAFPFQVATYTFLEQLTGQDAASEKEKALACQVDSLFGKFKSFTFTFYNFENLVEIFHFRQQNTATRECHVGSWISSSR